MKMSKTIKEPLSYNYVYKSKYKRENCGVENYSSPDSDTS